jgi:hypothetical protein
VTASMSRGRSQVIWKYMPGSVFRYAGKSEWCRVSHVDLASSAPLSKSVGAVLARELRKWEHLAPGSPAFPDPIQRPHEYVEGAPQSVWFDLWPTLFACSNKTCRRIYYYSDIDTTLTKNANRYCYRCKKQGALTPVRFGFIHRCGMLDTLFVPRHEPRHWIVLRDDNDFRNSYWYCEDCHLRLEDQSRNGLGFRSCRCGLPPRGMSGVLLEDTKVHYSQTATLVDIDDKQLGRWGENPRFGDLLLTASIGAPAFSPSDLLDLVQAEEPTKGESPTIRAVRDELLARGMSPEEVEALVGKVATKVDVDPWSSYLRDLPDINRVVRPRAWAETRGTIEYVFLKHSSQVGTVSLSSLISQAEAERDSSALQRLEGDRRLSQRLGISELSLLSAMPLKLIGYGFTRQYNYPASGTGDETGALLRPYPEVERKLPIYVVANTSEALLFELDPWHVAAFLQLSGEAVAPNGLSNEWLARATLLQLAGEMVDTGSSHLVLTDPEREAGQQVDVTAALIFGVVHSIAHVLQQTAHRYVGMDADALAEYLFPAHISGLLYIASHVKFTLGGLESIFRANLGQLLASAQEYAQQCAFDPVCTQSGGACMACVYPKFGCGHFNRTVSRAFLFGGNVAGRSEPLVGFWDRRVLDLATELRPPQGVPSP